MQKYVIYKVAKNLYGMPAEIIQDMVVLPPVTPVPRSKAFIRGIINLRGKVIPAIDFRKRLGINCLLDENIELSGQLKQREAEHRQWIDELELCVRESREFKLAIDPRKCKFGKWQDSFHTDDLALKGLINRFNTPHKMIHTLAAEAIAKRDNGQIDEALKIVENGRTNILNLMIRLFGQIYTLLEDDFKELSIVIDSKTGLQGIIVDKIVSIQNIDQENIKPTAGLNLGEATELTDKVAEIGNDIVMLIDPEKIAGAI